MAIVITYLEKWSGLPRNSASVINARGQIVMTYAKVHTSDMKATESNCTPGDGFYVCDLDLGHDTVRIGIMICFDREFPESARILMVKGAEIILTPNACNLEEKRLSQFRVRAIENALGVAMAKYAEPFLNGHSCAYDANGDELLLAGAEEGLFVVSFDLEKLRRHRARTIYGNSFRRPHRYGALTDPAVAPPFLRNNGLGKPFDRLSR